MLKCASCGKHLPEESHNKLHIEHTLDDGTKELIFIDLCDDCALDDMPCPLVRKET